MPRRDLPDADRLDGTESLILSQKGRARKGWVGLVCDYVMSCINRGDLKGEPGNRIAVGNGPPDETVGNDGDLYIEPTTGDVYAKE